MEHAKHGTPIEWLVPLAFCFAFAWVIWQCPAFILDFGPANQQLEAQFERTDILPGLSPLFAYGDFVDYLALVLTPIIFFAGVMTVQRAPMEYYSWRPIDRAAVFIGRVTMMLIVLMVAVMLYEVFMRYVMDNGTLWANELSLWMAGFVFLFAGLYAMQQRSHIRIFLIYDMVPRWLQKVFDILSTAFIVMFAFFLIYGSYKEAITKFMRWELFGTAFDPPLPATIKLSILLVMALVAIQAVINLISDWNDEPVVHSAADDIDQDELAKLRAAVGQEGTGDLDVTRGAIEGSQMKRQS